MRLVLLIKFINNLIYYLGSCILLLLCIYIMEPNHYFKVKNTSKKLITKKEEIHDALSLSINQEEHCENILESQKVQDNNNIDILESQKVQDNNNIDILESQKVQDNNNIDDLRCLVIIIKVVQIIVTMLIFIIILKWIFVR